MFRTDLKVGWDCGVRERSRQGGSEHSLDFEEKPLREEQGVRKLKFKD